ncbi:MAG: Hsp20/alpha crystallin family protein [Gemmatimonadetes bacterium]|jgi:HSP20 family protein|nr:Hsp20/alpha crystallin family protein [Gemmatimonadota bacterium]MBP7550458.1 Hsp20/alpha crystallin family protein [Gemmatimonadaceae bacterium]
MSLLKQDLPVIFERDLGRMRNRLQRFFEEPFGLDLRLPAIDEKRMEKMVWTPNVEATETPAEYVLTAELPGISPENVEVAVAEGMITLKGHKLEEKKEGEKDRTFHLWERTYGEFARSFRFPVPVNEAKVAAEFTNGILKVTVPKLEVTPPQTRTVPIAKK